MKYWLIKSEPDAYSIDDLKRDRKTCWDGVRNYQARNILRDEMKKGDLVVFYHSRVAPMAAVGVCEVVAEGYPDHTQFDPKGAHYDPKADPDDPRWYMVDVKYRSTFGRPVTLAEMRDVKALADLPLLRRGMRLSVQPMTKKHFDTICRLAER